MVSPALTNKPKRFAIWRKGKRIGTVFALTDCEAVTQYILPVIAIEEPVAAPRRSKRSEYKISAANKKLLKKVRHT